MKIASFLGISVMMFACGVSKKQLVNVHVDNIAKGEVNEYIFNAERTDSTLLSIGFMYYHPVKNVYQDSVNFIIQRDVKLITEFEKIKETPELNDDFFKKQLAVFVSMYEEEIDPDMGSTWGLDCHIQIEDTRPTYAYLSISEWNYTGGAHGNGSSVYYLIDKTTGKELMLKDFFKDIDELNRISEPIFRVQKEIDPDQDLSEAGFWFENNVFSLNNNFYFNEDQLIVFYNWYEIAPYAAGPTELIIPLEKVKHLLKRTP